MCSIANIMGPLLLQCLSLGVLVSLAAAQECPSGYARASPDPPSTCQPGVSTIEWHRCGTEGEPRLECAYLEVPLDWTKPSAEKLQLPVVRIVIMTFEHMC